ncbi:MAG TPA: Sb-PDE family phosphodiesterase [Eudoraea sp.]|nr:Sb-PDE family phosphodiesterase [Eudoraea sp.]
MKKLYSFCVLVLINISLNAQVHSHGGANPIEYPDIPGYKTLKADLHIHSVFSDGNVWPTIRVQEALRDGLDAISLTEHLEYQPHKDDIPHPDRNRAYHLAIEEGKVHELLIIPGSEITRSEPVGHSNAVFISDANALLEKEAAATFAAAKKQNAFVFWNHPAWYAQNPKGNPILSDFQKERIKRGELHGIEVINSVDYAQESLALALEQNLTIMGTSDIHGLITWDYTEKGRHRPVTLVFARDKSVESLREALFAGRTVAAYNSLLIGKSEFLDPLIKASIRIEKAAYIPKTQVLQIDLKNISSCNLLFENQMPWSFYSSSPIFEIPAGGTYTLKVKTLEIKEQIGLRLKALKAFSAPGQQAVIEWEVKVK